ncbi:hypothetical protein CAPTEDRAFT_168386 [Capitella teleta]|uniref:Glycine amidinotransferase n=1 Tax=Capitella teleta TaxID=283909 RepID=R7TEA5_CAPTE|nr:hypothetical protein CAPTEDRAFT_168386 [Capitella teleta]|eukprot:ELT92098.1 hypothetical protein CAPTEDRAFT_168386 [Capitella teleta]
MASRLLRRVSTLVRGASSSQRCISSNSISQDVPVLSWNEWDPLEEIVVGRAEGQRIPFLHPDLKAKTGPDAWKWLQENGGKPHDPEAVKKASAQIEELCNVLRGEGVKVQRPEPMRWDEMGTFNTPYFEDGGLMNACPRDGLMVVGDEIIEAPMAWRSRVFEYYAYKKMFAEYFKRGAKWTAAPRPAMGDDLFVKDFPFEDLEARAAMVAKGDFVLTEAEPCFDAADALRFGRDIIICLSHGTNRSGVEWLRRHVAHHGINVHSLVFKGLQNCHADATFIPLKPGVLVTCPMRPCLLVNDIPTDGWEWFSKRGWEVHEVPEPVVLKNTHYVSKWVHMNVLSIDEERVVMQKGEEPLKNFFIKLGMKPIEVDIQHANQLGGAFHCWTLDIKRRGTLQNYFS